MVDCHSESVKEGDVWLIVIQNQCKKEMCG